MKCNINKSSTHKYMNYFTISYKTSGVYPLQVLNILLQDANKSASGWLLSILTAKCQLHCISQRQQNMTDSSCSRWLALRGRLIVHWSCNVGVSLFSQALSAPDTLNSAVWCRVAAPLSPSCLSPGFRWGCTFSTNPWPDVHISLLSLFSFRSFCVCVFAWWCRQIKRERVCGIKEDRKREGRKMGLWDWAMPLSSVCLGWQTPLW